MVVTGKDAALSRRLLSMLDLTALSDTAEAAAISSLAAHAVTPVGRVAALCTWPRLSGEAVRALAGTDVAVSVVVNFPSGNADVRAAAEETAGALAAGATEVDVVLPWRRLLAGDRETPRKLVAACREACGSHARLKVILETGQLGTPAQIREAAELAIAGGADFLKTSTGKLQPGPTFIAAEVMLDAIDQAQSRDIRVGFKAAGGIRTLADAAAYLGLYERRFGRGSAAPDVFRIGASQLVHELLAVATGSTVSETFEAGAAY